MNRCGVGVRLLCLMFCATAEAGYRTVELDIELPRKRNRHVAARLGDGSLAVLGGFGVYKARNVMLIPSDFSQVEALDLEGGWCGYDLAGIGLPDGNVLLIDGGREVVYDYRSKSVKSVENELPYKYIRWATLTELSSGRILVSGGDTDDFKPIQTWAVYDPTENRFTASGTMAKARTKHAAVELEDGRVLLVGSGDQTAEILDVNSGETTLLDARPIHERYLTRMVRLDNGCLLLMGGQSEHCELFDPKTMTFRETASMGLPRGAPVLWKHGHEVLVIGGTDNSRVIEIYDEDTEHFRINEALLVYPRSSGFTVTPFDKTSALVVGGRVNSGEEKLNKIERVIFEGEGVRPGVAADISTHGAPAAVVTIYEGGAVKRALPVSGLAGANNNSWRFKNNGPLQTFLAKGLADCRDARLEVAFTPGVPYADRVRLLHMIGFQDIHSIQVIPDLSVPEVRHWAAVESPELLLPTESEIAAVKQVEPYAAELVYSVDDYDSGGDPYADLLKSMEIAAREGRHILLQAGGKWCGCCTALTEYFESNVAVSHVLNKNYVIQKVNVSQENMNEAFFARFPKIGGYPHLFVLDAQGKLLHSQGTGPLEDGGSYHEGAMLEFLNKWTPAKER